MPSISTQSYVMLVRSSLVRGTKRFQTRKELTATLEASRLLLHSYFERTVSTKDPTRSNLQSS